MWKSKKDSAVCTSTEEMISELKKVNNLQDDKDLVLGSVDTKALCPSLDIDLMIEKVCDIFLRVTCRWMEWTTKRLGSIW